MKLKIKHSNTQYSSIKFFSHPSSCWLLLCRIFLYQAKSCLLPQLHSLLRNYMCKLDDHLFWYTWAVLPSFFWLNEPPFTAYMCWFRKQIVTDFTYLPIPTKVYTTNMNCSIVESFISLNYQTYLAHETPLYGGFTLYRLVHK